jgi:hypothetical protein
VIAEMTTDPCYMVYSFPSYSKVDVELSLSCAILNPLKPTGAVKQALKSSYILATSTLS